MKPIPPLVMVTWEDALRKEADAWIDHPDKHEYTPQICHSVGFLLHEDKQGVIITASWNQDQMAPRDQIPRGMIRKIVRLKA